ncbi:MAG: DUF370 domain-containing protein [Clostridiales bacterium]|nr:MAG: DUF370 domain-containing protein [Clostridiales bacterium]
MFLHIGMNYMLKTKYIVAIFDIENTSECQITRDFLAKAEKSGKVITVGYELPKSYIIYNEKGKSNIYLTQFSIATLQKRLQTERE